MKNKVLSAVCAISLAAVMGVSFAACGSSGLSQEKAEEMIAGFTTTPSVVSGTWTQDFYLEVDSDNASFKAFEKDITATVTFDLCLTAGSVYYYGKLVQGSDTTEQIVAAESGTYYYATTETGKTELSSESAAITKIAELFKTLTYQTSGWLDTDAFVYDADWIGDYVMLGSANVSTSNSNYFVYTYSKTDDDGLKVDVECSYVGYVGDSGIVDMGTNDTYTGSTVSITTDSNGYITSFSQSVNNYVNFALTSDGIPLYYTGTRSLVAVYGGTITQKTISSVNENIAGGEEESTTSAITVYENKNCTISTYDYDGTQASLATESDTVTVGNYVAVKVTPDSGYEVAVVLINGVAATNYHDYYCVLAEKSDTTYNVAVTLKATDAETASTAKAIISTSDNYTVTCYDFDLSVYKFTESTIITEGHYVAVVVTTAESYELTSVTVNGEAATLQGEHYYCYMIAAVAGAEYNVDVVVTGYATIECNNVTGATIVIADFNLSNYSVTVSDSVEVGHFLAVGVTVDDGYKLVSVVVNDGTTDHDITTATYGSAYCCYKISAVGTYIVEVTVEQVTT